MEGQEEQKQDQNKQVEDVEVHQAKEHHAQKQQQAQHNTQHEKQHEAHKKQEQKDQEEYNDAQYTAATGDKKQSWFTTQRLKLKDFFVECKRVLIVTKKPTKEEFKTIVKVSGLGILIIGAIGFVIQLVEVLFK